MPYEYVKRLGKKGGTWFYFKLFTISTILMFSRDRILEAPRKISLTDREGPIKSDEGRLKKQSFVNNI